jgi:putative ubiquitin-RnfH superfamily antitoxin RatB of RatAB toxin-antitoxin module
MAAIRVEVVIARPGSVDAVSVRVPEGASVRNAIDASGLAGRHAVDWNAVGIFGRRVPADTRLAEGDRVEIYRSLLLDPKEQRRQRARKKVSGTTR